MRLIDADALKDALRKEQRWVIKRDGYHNEGFSYDQVMLAIDEQPAIEAEPKHGRWENDGHTLACSNCHTINIRGIAWHYCPNCGAKMDEVEECRRNNM